MNAFLLMIPLFFIRFVLLGAISKEALRRAAFFAPPAENEKTATYLYQVSNIFIIFYPLFLKIYLAPPLGFIGGGIYLLGILLLILSTIDFAKPAGSGINTNGIYKFSRNPMYLGYFFYFLGCVLLTQSPILLIALIVFQASAHFIILAEERWCLKQFGEEYKEYMGRVRRYF